MHHNEDKETSSAGTGEGRRMSKDNSNDDTFVSAMDLSGVLNSSQISTSSSDSNSSSSSFHYSSGNSDHSASLSTSTSVNSTSSSEKPGESNIDVTKMVICKDSPMFATCSTFSSSSSTASASTVRRSESLSALRSPSIDSSKSGGSDKENTTDFRTSVSSMKDQNESRHPETYHTPSASMHSISLNNKSNSELSQSQGDDASKNDDLKTVKIIDLDLAIDEKNYKNAPMSELVKSQALNTPVSPGEDICGKIEKVDIKEPSASGIVEIIGIDLNDFSSESNASKEGSIGISPTSKELAKAAKLARKPVKKRMWYQQIFSASYKSRSGDFKKLFKELPIKERLLVDYSCALQKEILVQGRMYVSQGYLSFHANIFGWETQTSIRLRDVTCITKEKTALVIPNAIQVVVDGGDKLFFTSFVTRDATFMFLFKLWQNALLEDGMPSKEIQRLIHSSYGEELVITSDDEIDDSLSCKSTVIGDLTDTGISLPNTIAKLEVTKSIVVDEKVSEIGASTILPRSLLTIGTPKIQEDLHNGLPRVGLEEPSDLSESSDYDEEFQAAEGIEELDNREIPTCPIPHTDGREVISTTISCSIDQLFTMLFTSSKFYLDFHTSRKTFNIHQAPWECGKDKKKTRQVSMTVSLTHVMGPKHSQITETQVMDTVSKPGLLYVIDCESVNAGVPYADTFYVTVHFCLSRISATETKFAAVADIKYKKSVWGITKSIIEKNAWAGLEEFYSHLERALKEECNKMILGGSPIPSPKHPADVQRRRPVRNKRKAPAIPIGIPPVRTGHIVASSDTPDLILTDTNLSATPFTSDSSLVLKIILCILCALLLLNAFLYYKLNHLENSATSSTLFPPPSFTFTGEMPQNHQDWLLLIQKQEALHRVELQKWHEILMSALQILHQAESDLEALKFHISSYSGGKYSAEMTTKPTTDPESHTPLSNIKSDESNNNQGRQTGEYFKQTSQYLENTKVEF